MEERLGESSCHGRWCQAGWLRRGASPNYCPHQIHVVGGGRKQVVINLHCLLVLHLALLLLQHVHLLPQHVCLLPQLPHLQPLLCQAHTAGSEPTPPSLSLCPLTPLSATSRPPKPPLPLWTSTSPAPAPPASHTHPAPRPLPAASLRLSSWPCALEIGHSWRQSVPSALAQAPDTVKSLDSVKAHLVSNILGVKAANTYNNDARTR